MDKFLYLGLNIGAILFPVLLSFDRKVSFYRKWKNVFLAILIVGFPFVVWDFFFTELEVWGFNNSYLTEFYLFNLPIEEVLFFVVVPFACTFIYECIKVYFFEKDYSKINTATIGFLFFYSVVILVQGVGNWYSTIVAILALILLVYFYRFQKEYRFFSISFLLSMIPFFLMNGVLTGAITAEPIVWYNGTEIIGWRYLTIPFEDVLYSFALLFLNIIVYEWLERKAIQK